MKQTRKHVRDVRDFNNIETRAVIKFLFLQGKAPKEIHAILTEILACFLPGRAKDLSAPLVRVLKLTKAERIQIALPHVISESYATRRYCSSRFTSSKESTMLFLLVSEN